MNLSTLLALHAAATQLFGELAWGGYGGLVNDGFWALDCVAGTVILALVS